jgi:putative transposase
MSYPSDLEAAHWEQIAHHFEPRDRRGSSHKHPKKEIVEGILYVVRTGCQWRQLPNDCPPWKTVYDHFRNWNLRGVWERTLSEITALQRKKRAKRSPPVTGSSTRRASRPSTGVRSEGSTGIRKSRGASGISW